MEIQQLLKQLERQPQDSSADPQPMTASQPIKIKSRTLLPALASALLLWACYFPLNAGWLGWVALVPMLCLVRSPARPRVLYISAWVGALVFFTASLQWVRVADHLMYWTWGGLSIWCALFVPVGIFLMRRLDRRKSLPLLVTVPVVWTGLEFARAHLLTGFPWYFLAHTQHDYLPVIQISDLGGAYAVSFLVAAVNVVVFELLGRTRWFQRFGGLSLQAVEGNGRTLALRMAVVALMLGGTLAYGGWRLSQQNFEQGPVVALLQGNLDQRIRIMASTPGGPEEAFKTVQQHYASLCSQAAARHPQLIVWPETSFVYLWWKEVCREIPIAEAPVEWQQGEEAHKEAALTVAKHWGTNLLLGLNTYVFEADRLEHRYNSAVLVQPDGNVFGRYDKMHCVPFGEYVPLRDWIPWMNKLSPYDFDYSVTSGKAFTRFPLGKYQFGVVICYEDTDPTLARQYLRPVDGKPAVDFLLNMSNDGWFDGTSQHEQHLAICRFRAIECRRALARSVNMGISAVIDGNGRVIALPGPDWARSKKIEKVIEAAMPIDRRFSLYAQWGDWLPWSCWLVIGVGFLLSAAARVVG